MFLVIEIGSRYLHILGVTTNPDRPWTTQQARNLLADLADRTGPFRLLVPDRTGQFTRSLDATSSAGSGKSPAVEGSVSRKRSSSSLKSAQRSSGRICSARIWVRQVLTAMRDTQCSSGTSPEY